MIIKMCEKLLLDCNGPTKSMWMWEKRHCGMGIDKGLSQTWRWILPRRQERQDRVHAVMSLEIPHQTNLEETRRREASLPGWEMLNKFKNISRRNFCGTMGQKTPVETSPARPWAPAWRKASLRDVPLSKTCVSAQLFCSAAFASKLTGSAAAATSPVGSGGEGRDKKSATSFLRPGRYNICILNSEMNATWRCCLGEIGMEKRVKALTRGLWSVQSWKWRPSQKCLKCLIAACAANNSQSKVE